MSSFSDDLMSSFSDDQMVSLPNSSPPDNFLERLSNECLLLIIDKVTLPKHAHAYPRTDIRSLKSMSLVNKKLRQLCILSLFKQPKPRLFLGKDEHSAEQHFKSFVKAPFFSANLVSLKMRIVPSNMAPSDDLGQSLVAALTTMPKLRALSLNLDNKESTTSNIRVAFRASKATLPTVKVLEACEIPNAAFLLRACPSLRKFITVYPSKQWKKTFEVVATMSNLQAVWVTNEKGWKPGHFQELLQYVDNVRELCLQGDIYRCKLSNLAPFFSDLIELKSLFISTEQWVNYAYLSKRYFDDRYLDAIEDLKENSPYNEEADIVARSFFAACPSITTVRLVSHITDTFRFVREQTGSVNNISKGEKEDWPYSHREFSD
ncbi:hypothetical protein LTR84_000650 [Exophiala bonariae]|uniref:F-box domain-containing protein n=1 Tax=Exophiala bonariae TaxID=1690606 RepID=A0AAV9NS92_9EURO|nr:hypothetical protein LTR84_000650 [Exophiala bonariae]